MNGNFDYFTTINNNNGDDADLIPYWENEALIDEWYEKELIESNRKITKEFMSHYRHVEIRLLAEIEMAKATLWGEIPLLPA